MIQEITAFETLAVRHAILRPGKPIDTCRFEGDDMPSTKHFGYFEGGNLAGIVSVFEYQSPAFAETIQFQMRGMAVLEAWQKKGIGQKLVQFVQEKYAQQKGGILWFNARVSAFEFYKKLGFQVLGHEFEISGVGPHLLMFRKF